ncbi:MAG: hypothetical protein JNM56_39345 [Planctomycetia bacterium]|nr:hypothetical protein [Planctomycetia bacterium]
MRVLICRLIAAIARRLLALRYDITVHGLEHLQRGQERTLVLPNHPAFIDPVILLSLLYPWLRVRPLVYEANFRSLLFRPFGKLLRAISVPDLEHFSHERGLRIKAAIGEVMTGLRGGENHILWPAGWLRRDNLERLGGARAAADVLSGVPDARVLLIRTQGLWGSMFSFAHTGARPDFGRCLLRGFLVLLANGWFFAPRRRVTITIEAVPPDALPGRHRRTLNPWLERWYNVDGPETPVFVPYHFWFGPRTYRFPALENQPRSQRDQAAPPVKAAVAELLTHRLQRPLTPTEEQPQTMLDELGLDSMDRMELSQAIEQRFGHTVFKAPTTLGELWTLAQGAGIRKPTKPVVPG